MSVDYKIIVKLIADRLKNVLPLLINNDQTGYLKNRYIGENIRLLQDISFFTEHTKTIRHGKDIKGIQIDKEEIKLSMLADDLTLVLQDLKSIENALKLLDDFSRCSWLSINIEKTKAKYLGKPLTSDHYPHGLSWIKAFLETLGI